MKVLPIGTQSFIVLREMDYLYVDKTEDIYRMITSGRIYFLSRPRRFGKSLLVSTLDALFSGQKELFEGLYIYDRWDWSQQYPVIRLDFGACAYSSVEELKISLTDFVEAKARDYRLDLQKNTLSGKFGELITKLHLATGQRVVLLVDEYDKPITDYLTKHEVM
ncbi:MAG: AAA family ATPase, partial [Dysgonamonadaceae bacterium]|nr:AAA family ATPase [Dysgonamonadaceae bacterium]